MTKHAELLPHTQELLGRPTTGQIHFSDVFAEVAGADAEYWWRYTDFDSSLTVQVESEGFPGLAEVPIGLRPWFANYGLVLVDDLLRDQNERVANYLIALSNELHPDAQKEIRQNEGAITVVANYAPRDDKNTTNGANGSEFYLAVTDSGLEIYTTPLSFLNGLDARNRITALYLIPNQGHPEFDGEKEQFRSARVKRTRQHPDHLVPIFQYKSRREMLRAKSSGIHPAVIPQDPRTGRFAHVDKYGNVVAESADLRPLRQLEIGRLATLEVTDHGKIYEFGVEVSRDLASSPLGRLAVNINCSGYQGPDSCTGYFEVVSRVNGNPSTSEETAIFQILEDIPELDIETAELKLLA